MNQRERYKHDILTTIDADPRPKVAYHYNCCDGMVSGAIVRKLFEDKDLCFLPIDYSLLNYKEIRKELKKANWFAIVDLEPFNRKKIFLYSDHHISAKRKRKRAKHKYFVPGAPSTASLLWKAYKESLPPYITELAKMTEITDTASYTTSAPTVMNEDFDNYSWDEKIWFLEDACKTAYSLVEHETLSQILAFEGLKGLRTTRIITRIEKLRKGRKDTEKIVNGVDIKDFVILIDSPKHFNTTFIAHEIMKKGAKGAAYLTVYSDVTRISLRLSKSLTKEEVEQYRVDILAASMNGGGHKPASGAQTDDENEAKEKILDWVKNKGWEPTIVDLRNMEK